MPVPVTSQEFIQVVRKSGLVDGTRLDTFLNEQPALPEELKPLAEIFVRDGLLTNFQAKQLLKGRYRGFQLGKYKILEQLGQGGMGAVYLCEHLLMRRRVAIKVLPQDKAGDPASLERFYREARAVAALDHPNIVRAHDIDQEGHLHFLVMEYVDGHSLQDIVKRHGPMDLLRSTHYIRQAAIGLQHLHEAGLVHRDIKPGNLLLDRQGTIKILDMGLARSFREGTESVTKQFDEKSVLGTADYLAPEQAMCSSDVDIRADIYSLGATWYFMLSGSAPFEEGTITQKLLWHQMRQPKPLLSYRPELPPEIIAIIEKMMSKDAKDRYQTPNEVAQALETHAQTPIPMPPEEEMPRLCGAATSSTSEGSMTSLPASFAASGSRFQGIGSNNTGRSSGVYTPVPGAADSVRVGLSGIREQSAGSYDSSNSRRGLGQGAPTQPVPHSGRLSSVSDTDNPMARGDTRPSGTRIGSGRFRKREQTLSELFRAHKRWLLIGVASAAVVIVGLGLIIWKLMGIVHTDRKPPGFGGTAVITLIKKASGDRQNFKTLIDAVNHAEEEDRIIVGAPPGEKPLLEDRLVASGGDFEGKDGQKHHRKNITIEADPEFKVPVRWTPRANLDPDTPLITITGFEGLKLRGFAIDGRNRLNDLIVVTGRCPALTLEDVKLSNFVSAGVRFVNGSGDRDRPMTLERVAFDGSQEGQAASGVVFGINAIQEAPVDPTRTDNRAPPPNQNQNNFNAPQLVENVKVHDCIFFGPLRAGANVRDAVNNIVVEKNRFCRLTAAVAFNKNFPLRRATVTLDSNTIVEMKSGAFHFEVLPPADDDNQLRLHNNLFVQSERLVVTDSKAHEPPGLRAKWIWLNEGDPLRAAPPGDCFFRKTFQFSGKAKHAVLDVVCDDAFEAYVNSSQAGQGNFVLQRSKVRAFDVTDKLQNGRNVIAIKGTNRDGPAGLLVRLRVIGIDGKLMTIVTDDSWRVTKQKNDIWHTVELNDDAWPRPKVLADYGGGNDKWRGLHWEGLELDQFRDLNPAFVRVVGGNVRDPGTNEGALLLDVPAAIGSPINTDRNSPQFLRYPKDSPFATAGADKKPVGYPPY